MDCIDRPWRQIEAAGFAGAFDFGWEIASRISPASLA
jgi:hypothetical protein